MDKDEILAQEIDATIAKLQAFKKKSHGFDDPWIEGVRANLKVITSYLTATSNAEGVLLD